MNVLEIVQDGQKVYLKGEVDVGNCATFKSELNKVVEKTMVDLVLDFEELMYIDSAGLGILVGVFKRLQEKNLSFEIINANDFIKKLFRITKLETLFKVL